MKNDRCDSDKADDIVHHPGKCALMHWKGDRTDGIKQTIEADQHRPQDRKPSMGFDRLFSAREKRISSNPLITHHMDATRAGMPGIITNSLTYCVILL